jgi:uncharacterized protein YjbI with pentapeptide repeats
LAQRDQFTGHFCLNSPRVCRRVPSQYQTSATYYKSDNEEQFMKANKRNEVNQQIRIILSSILAIAVLSGAPPSMAENPTHVEKLKATKKCEDCNLKGANLKGMNLQGVGLYRTLLSDADLTGADLQGAYMRRADLRGANLTNANLTGVELSSAYLQNANLAGANLAEANLEGSTFCKTTMPDGTVNNDNC